MTARFIQNPIRFVYALVLIGTIVVLLILFLLRGNSLSSALRAGELLRPIGGDKDNALLVQMQQRSRGDLCAIVVRGRPRLMSFGSEALVDIGNGPIRLSLHPVAGNSRAQYIGDGVTVSGHFVDAHVADPTRAVTYQTPVEVQVHARSENVLARWTCQARLIVVKTR